MEPRLLLSAFYRFDVIAQSGARGLVGINPEVSINDTGKVAFVGQFSGSSTSSEEIFVGDGSGPLVSITPGWSSSDRDFGYPQINNSDQVAIRERVSGVPPSYLIRTWNADAPGTWTLDASEMFGDALTFPSISNDGNVSYVHLYTSGSTVDTGLELRDPTFGLSYEAALFSGVVSIRPMVADGGKIVLRAGGDTASPIAVYEHEVGGAFALQAIATSSMGFTSLGQCPGISDDGQVVAFYGERSQGPGIYASYNEEGVGWCVPFLVAGGNTKPDLGYDASGNPQWFSSFAADSRVSVAHESLGAAGLDGDSLVISFIATPNGASRDNPAAQDVPLLYSAETGIWTVRVDIERQLGGPPALVAHPRGALPVIQVGDRVEGQTISTLAVYDSVANAPRFLNGTPNAERRGDHRLAFMATTASGAQLVVRAEHLDSDEDGLLDHWEQENGGIDMDRDGTIDLDLHAMGADPFHRDLFIEVDWLNNRPPGSAPVGWSNEPPPGALQWLANMFANAPALPNGIPAGITLHIDAGPGRSINMNGTLQGGDRIAEPGTGAHLDLVYMGPRGSVNVSGLHALSYGEVKDSYFGHLDKDARELAFHYVVLADFSNLMWADQDARIPFTNTVTAATPNTLTIAGTFTDFSGNSIDVTKMAAVEIIGPVGNPAAGQIRNIVGVNPANNTLTVEPWATQPGQGSQFVLLSTSSGMSEVGFYDTPDANSFPGNDVVVSMGGFAGTTDGILANDFYVERTLAHELGHNLGLRHGGTDQYKYKPDSFDGRTYPNYGSLMNYRYQSDPTGNVKDHQAPPAGANVNSYSGAGDPDPTYDDWQNLKLDFQASLWYLGTTLDKVQLGDTPPTDYDDGGMTRAEIEALIGPIDLTGPSITINSPAANASVHLASTLNVNLTITDPSGIGDVQATFDINGDGDTTDPGEAILATHGAGDTYTASFAGVSGPDGSRLVGIEALDTLGNPQTASVSVNVTASNTPPRIASLTANPDPFHLGRTLTLTANGVVDDDGIVSQVGFWADSHENGYLDGCDALLGTDTSSEGGWSISVATSDLPTGTGLYFAAAWDDSNAYSDVAVATGPPNIASLTVSPNPVNPGANLTLTANGVVDDHGLVTLVSFWRDSNNDGVLDSSDTLLGTDTSSDGGWSISVATTGLPTGTNRYFAEACNDSNAWSDVAATTGMVSEITIVGQRNFGDGLIVTFYDVDPGNGLDVPYVAWGTKPGPMTDIWVSTRGIAVDSIQLLGRGHGIRDLGIFVEGNCSLTIVDSRKGTLNPLGFIVSDGWAGSVNLRSGIQGANLNGFPGPSGRILPADIDRDGSTNDLTALLDNRVLGRVTIAGAVTGDVVVRGANAASLTLGSTFTGDIRVDGDLAKLSISGLWSGAGAIPARLNTLFSVGTVQAGRVGNVIVSAQTRISSIRAVDWADGSISTGGLGSLKITGDKRQGVAGDFGADLTLTGYDASKLTLGSATIAGRVTGGTWAVTGDSGAIRVSSAAQSWEAGFSRNVASLTSAGLLSGTVSARSVKSISAGGNIDHLVLTLQPPDPSLSAIGSLTAKGWLDGCRILSSGNVGTVTAGGMRNTSLFAGVAAPTDAAGTGGQPDGVFDFPDLGDLAPPLNGLVVRISALTLKGIKVGSVYQDSFINSNVAAGSLGKASLCYARLDNDGNASATDVPFGLLSGTPNSFSLSYSDFSPGHKFAWKPGEVLPAWLAETDLRVASG